LLSRDVSLESRVTGNIKKMTAVLSGVWDRRPKQLRQSIPMTEFVPSGYISIREALNRLGRELFGSKWTGEEHKARSGLISADEWLKTKDLPGLGHSGGGSRPRRVIIERTLPVTASVRSTGDPRGRKTEPTDPCDPSYQAEYRAAERHAAARHELRIRLEAGHLEAAILDPYSGELYRAPARMVAPGRCRSDNQTRPSTKAVRRQYRLAVGQTIRRRERACQAAAGGRNRRSDQSLEGKNSDRKSDAVTTGGIRAGAFPDLPCD
jgi:hypothetical protein